MNPEALAGAVVVADTGPLIALAGIDRLDLLSTLFERVLVPHALHEEMLAGGDRDLGLEVYRRTAFLEVREVAEIDPALEALLHRGEASVVALALSADADLVLIDEQKARKVARSIYGLTVVGSVRVLIEKALTDAASRLAYPPGVVLFSDGEPSYEKLFRRVFDRPYRPARRGSRGRFPKVRYRLTRRQAHVVVRKTRRARRLVGVEVRVAHGSRRRVARELSRLGFSKANTSTIERRNATARSMDATSLRKTLAFAKNPGSPAALGAWGVMVYNWARTCRSLRRPLAQPRGRQLYERRFPAMAAGLTDRVWTIRELLHSPTYPAGGKRCSHRQQRPDR